MKKVLLVIAILVAAYFGLGKTGSIPSSFVSDSQTGVSSEGGSSDAALANAFSHHETIPQVEGHGTVIKLLHDDVEGDRHQKFLVRLANGQTLLVAHNIELAPRVSPLNAGDEIQFSGEYVWNPNGGVIHWTHRDPNGRHPAGWIKHNGQTYQ